MSFHNGYKTLKEVIPRFYTPLKILIKLSFVILISNLIDDMAENFPYFHFK